jgi:hypothetical protein
MRVLVILLALASAGVAQAKQIGVHTPSGRRIYAPEETFGELCDQDTRHLVIEVAAGMGPEGNLGMLLGWLNVGVRGLELYGGIGLEANPAVHVTGALRYVANVFGLRPYLSLGYLYKDTYAIDVWSHNLFGEVGYKWILHHTYHLTVGVGVRRMLAIYVDDDSTLFGPGADAELLSATLDEVGEWAPMVSLRFSRAF